MTEPKDVGELSRVELSIVSALTDYILDKVSDFKEKEDGWAKLDKELKETKVIVNNALACDLINRLYRSSPF